MRVSIYQSVCVCVCVWLSVYESAITNKKISLLKRIQTSFS